MYSHLSLQVSSLNSHFKFLCSTDTFQPFYPVGLYTHYHNNQNNSSIETCHSRLNGVFSDETLFVTDLLSEWFLSTLRTEAIQRFGLYANVIIYLEQVIYINNDVFVLMSHLSRRAKHCELRMFVQQKRFVIAR